MSWTQVGGQELTIKRYSEINFLHCTVDFAYRMWYSLSDGFLNETTKRNADEKLGIKQKRRVNNSGDKWSAMFNCRIAK